MGIYRIKACFLALAFLFGCSSPNDFAAINSDKSYAFNYNGFEKSLFVDKKAHSFGLVFFTKDCGVCNEQIPILQTLAQKNGFEIFIVLADAKDKKDAFVWANEKKLTLPMFYEKKAVYFLSKAVGDIYGVPVLSFFEQGKMHKKFIGLTPLNVLESEIKKIQFKNPL